jgi:biopolymer transport protein ExbB
MFDIIQKGGVLMYPIMLLSVMSLAIFMERMYTLRREKYVPANFAKKLHELLQKKEYNDAANICDLQDNALSRIVSDLMKNKNHSRERLVTVAEEAGRREADRLTRFQETMTMIVALAPLLGLLGTIFGMITIFNVISAGSIGNAEALSGGIAEALLTTAAGLSVAIPAQVFYYIIKYRSDYIVRELELQTSEVINLLTAGGE